MMMLVFLILLTSWTECLHADVGMEPEYSPASSLHIEPTLYASASEMSPYPRHLDIDALKNMPLVILHSRTPIKLKMIRGENMQDVHKSLTPERIIKLLKSAASSYSEESKSTPKKASLREAKNIHFDSSQARSLFSLPLGGHQSLLPSSSNLFSRPFVAHETGSGWQQRFRNSFSNMFSFAKPFSGMAATNRPVFMSSPQPNFQIPGSYNPFQQPFHSYPSGMWNQFQPVHSFSSGDFSTAASVSNPAKLQLGSYFNPYHHSAIHQGQLGGDLAMSGAHMMPHRIVPAPNHAFAHYVSTVPRHKPLFNNVGGLKAASLEIRNAFADFTASDEHGPEVSQKFGSVGHVMNKFLDMMGLGAAGGITDDGEGNFGGAGNWASMESSPISRSLDFYPGYGNQAHLDDIEDFPIFLEDITEQFLTKMNLTHLLKNDTKTPDSDSKKDSTKAKSSSSDVKEKSKDSLKMKEKPATKEKMAKPDAPTHTEKDLPKYSDSLYVPAHTLEMMQNKNKDKESTSKGNAKPNPNSSMKMDASSDNNKKTSDSVPDAPLVNYRVPSTLSTVAPHDRIPPVAVFSSFPPKSSDEPAPAPPSYSPAMPLPQHEFEDNPNKLVDEDDLRPWVPVTNGRGYVEKRPKPFIDITKTSDQPRSLKIVEQVLSSSSRTY
ncbi:uncharacterized protein LOC129971052 [Argiope bruennichi]|uniref:uncharacterized protein LOC129971052 n=1 Tax=Argiope bruennichi TaxID=94029 RepID=UPI0024942A84|nr:uncharacterized protein LOC129971052 [Argiope bruennichi]